MSLTLPSLMRLGICIWCLDCLTQFLIRVWNIRVRYDPRNSNFLLAATPSFIVHCQPANFLPETNTPFSLFNSNSDHPMSLRKPPSSLPKWPRLQPPSRHPLSPPHTNTHHVLNDRRTATSSRPFHSTPPKCAKWATPSLSKRRRTKVPLFTNDYLMTESAAGDPRPYLQNIEAHGEKYLEVSKSYDFPNIPPYLSAKTFKSVARELAAVASKNPPSAHAIRSVSKGMLCCFGLSCLVERISGDTFIFVMCLFDIITCRRRRRLGNQQCNPSVL